MHGARAEDRRGVAHWRINSVVDSTLPAKIGILREQRNIRFSGTNDDYQLVDDCGLVDRAINGLWLGDL